MKTLRAGVLPTVKEPWVGQVAECANCGARVQLESGDIPNYSVEPNPDGFTICTKGPASPARAHELFRTADPLEWAKAFAATLRQYPELAHDRATLYGWFSNAMSTAKSHRMDAVTEAIFYAMAGAAVAHVENREQAQTEAHAAAMKALNIKPAGDHKPA